MGYFQFNGSDFVVVLKQGSHIQFACDPERRHRQGQQIGLASARERI